MQPVLDIVHLSDLHFDTTTGAREAKHQSIWKAVNVIGELGYSPDYIIVTGDFFRKGPCKLDEFAKVLDEYLERLVGYTKTKTTDAIVISPGNHDFYLASVLTKLDTAKAAEEKEKLREFLRHLCERYITPFDASPERRRVFSTNGRYLIYPVNSCPLVGSDVVLRREDWVKADGDLKDMLPVFQELRSNTEEAEQESPGLTKIAVMHHNIYPHVETESIALYSNRLAGMFEYELADLKFNLLLHGHTHEKTAIRELSKIGDANRLFVVSAPSVGSFVGGQESGFNIIRIIEEDDLFSGPDSVVRCASVTAAKTQDDRDRWIEELLPLSESLPRTFPSAVVAVTVAGINAKAKDSKRRLGSFPPGLLLIEKVAGGEAVRSYADISAVELKAKLNVDKADEAVKRMIDDLDLGADTAGDLFITSCGTGDQYAKMGYGYWEKLAEHLFTLGKTVAIHNLFFVEDNEDAIAMINRHQDRRSGLIKGAALGKAKLSYKARYMVVPSLKVCTHKGIWVMDYAVATKAKPSKEDRVVIFDHVVFSDEYEIQLLTGNGIAQALKESVKRAFDMNLAETFK